MRVLLGCCEMLSDVVRVLSGRCEGVVRCCDVVVVVGQVRRMISTVSVRAQAQCLLSRVNLIGGEGVTRASKRRQWVAIEEERMRCERIAQWIGRVRGQNIVRRGEFLID